MPILYVIGAMVIALSSQAYGHAPLIRLQDRDKRFYVSPRVYHSQLEYLPPQSPNTEVTAAYGINASVQLPLTYISPRLTVAAHFDMLAGPGHTDTAWLALQREFGIRYTFPSNISLGMVMSKHDLNPDIDLNSLEYVRWTAPTVSYDFTIPLSRFQADSHLEFYYFHPHNEFDPNPAVIPMSQRVVARYALDYAMIWNPPNNSPLFLATRFFVPLGDSRPQTDYNYRADLIGLYLQARLGWQVDQRLSVFLEYGDWYDLGGMVSSRELDPTASIGLGLGF
jgi:hypothetical protein